MRTGWLHVLDRPLYNGVAIRSRIERVRERSVRKPHRLRPIEVGVLFVAAMVMIVLVGLAFDALSVQRARAAYSFVRSIFQFISYIGQSKWELFPAVFVVLLLLFGDWELVPNRVRVAWAEIGALVAYIFAAIGGAGLLVNIIKQPIGRGRPPTFDTYGPFVLRPFEWTYNFQSFPSGHSTTAGCLIAIGVLVVPRWRVPLIVIGLLIAGSRVFVGAHYPSDVLAGLLFGYSFSLWLAGRFADLGWAFARGSTGLISARAAASRRAFRSAAGIAILAGGLLDALAGRRIWLPARDSIESAGVGPKAMTVDELAVPPKPEDEIA